VNDDVDVVVVEDVDNVRNDNGRRETARGQKADDVARSTRRMELVNFIVLVDVIDVLVLVLVVVVLMVVLIFWAQQKWNNVVQYCRV
jgi:t-SNARE complex subunit (syntaxin)